MKHLIFIVILILLVSFLIASEQSIISVFYKEMIPSQKVLARVDSLLVGYADNYEIKYFNIEEEKNAELIKEIGLPETHFPFAVVINGKFAADINGKSVSFVHFPLFMKGIGRHEGNWSLEDLRKVLENNTLLFETNILPVLDEETETSECEE